jgi:O-antigen/teichoic acid export membrane protein
MDRTILKNVTVNFVGLVLPTFVSLVTVPYYIRLLGVERYGVVSLVWILIGYFSALDLGMSMAAQNAISRARASGDADACAQVFWSATWLNLATGIFGSLIIYFGTFLYTAYFAKAAPQLQHEIYMTLPWIAIAIPLANVSWVFAGAINGAERFGSYNTAQTAGTFLFQLLPLGAARVFGPTLEHVVAAAVIARALMTAFLGHSALSVLQIRGVRAPRIHIVKALLNFGGWTLVTSVAGMVTDSLDRMLLGAGLGARFVTYYSVPKNLVTRLNIIPVALERTLFPRLSAVGRERAESITEESLGLLNSAFTPIVIVAIFAIVPFMHFWVGDAIAAVAAPIGRILIVAVWLAGQADTMRILVQAQMRPAAAARVSLFELPLFVAALWFGIRQGGLTGAALAVVGRSMLDYGLFSWLSGVRAFSIAFDMLAHLAFLVASLWISDVLTELPLAIMAGTALAAGNLIWSIVMTPSARNLVRSLMWWLNQGRRGV